MNCIVYFKTNIPQKVRDMHYVAHIYQEAQKITNFLEEVFLKSNVEEYQIPAIILSDEKKESFYYVYKIIEIYKSLLRELENSEDLVRNALIEIIEEVFPNHFQNRNLDFPVNKEIEESEDTFNKIITSLNRTIKSEELPPLAKQELKRIKREVEKNKKRMPYPLLGVYKNDEHCIEIYYKTIKDSVKKWIEEDFENNTTTYKSINGNTVDDIEVTEAFYNRITQTLAHELFHSIHYCIGMEESISQKARIVIESTADYFAYLWCLKEGYSYCGNKRCKEWCNQDIFSWPYAGAKYLLPNGWSANVDCGIDGNEQLISKLKNVIEKGKVNISSAFGELIGSHFDIGTGNKLNAFYKLEFTKSESIWYGGGYCGLTVDLMNANVYMNEVYGPSGEKKEGYKELSTEALKNIVFNINQINWEYKAYNPVIDAASNKVRLYYNDDDYKEPEKTKWNEDYISNIHKILEQELPEGFIPVDLFE